MPRCLLGRLADRASGPVYRALIDPLLGGLGDGSQLPLADSCLDLLLISLVLHASAPPLRAEILSEARRVLRPGGQLLVADYRSAAERGADGGLRGRYIIQGIERLAGAAHYASYRDFMAGAGVAALGAQAGFRLEQRLTWGDGLLGVYLFRR